MFNFQLNASKLAGPFCMCHLAYYAYPLAEKLSMYATVKVSSERCSTKGPTKMVGSAQRVTSTPRTINDYHWRSRFLLHVISKLTFCIPSTVKREDKETPDYRLNYHSLLWFHMVSLLSSRVKPLFKLRRAWHQRAVARPQWRRRKHRRSPYPSPRCKDQTESLGDGNSQKPYGRFNNDVSTWLCTVHAEWNARLALAGGGVKMF